MSFSQYDWVGIRAEKKEEKVSKNAPEQIFFVQKNLGDDYYVCDEYYGENHVRKHVIIQLQQETYEIKKIKATYKIREYYPDTATFIDNNRVFSSIDEINEAKTTNEIKTPFFKIWNVSINCDVDCEAFGVDPTAPWPPKAA